MPEEYLSQASSSEQSSQLSEIKKYGNDYYAFGDGTFKWYLKQYIDLAREKGAIPVLITPVARRSFNSDGTLKSGPGLHGEDFAYVKAVRSWRKKEIACLLITSIIRRKLLKQSPPHLRISCLRLFPTRLRAYGRAAMTTLITIPTRALPVWKIPTTISTAHI